MTDKQLSLFIQVHRQIMYPDQNTCQSTLWLSLHLILRAAANLILSGTMDRHPNIKIILAHAGGTLPYLTWRINQCYELIKQTMDNSKYNSSKSPEDYISDFITILRYQHS